MKPFAAQTTYARTLVIAELSKVRYPGTGRQISKKTMWRWCNLAGIDPGLKAFTKIQCMALAQVASWFQQGYSEDAVQSFLGETNHDKQRVRPQQQAPNAAPATDWSIFFGG
jgi:hypothetical protein